MRPGSVHEARLAVVSVAGQLSLVAASGQVGVLPACNGIPVTSVQTNRPPAQTHVASASNAPQEYVGEQLSSPVHGEPSASATVLGQPASAGGPTPLLEDAVLHPASPRVASKPTTTSDTAQFRPGGARESNGGNSIPAGGCGGSQWVNSVLAGGCGGSGCAPPTPAVAEPPGRNGAGAKRRRREAHAEPGELS